MRKRLSISRETIRLLASQSLARIAGGNTGLCEPTKGSLCGFVCVTGAACLQCSVDPSCQNCDSLVHTCLNTCTA